MAVQLGVHGPWAGLKVGIGSRAPDRAGSVYIEYTEETPKYKQKHSSTTLARLSLHSDVTSAEERDR
jgi:hypothetical protein